MSPSACRQNDGSTASCANSWVELFRLHFLNFDSSCCPQTASKDFPDPGSPAPISPSHVCCTSLRDSLLLLRQRGKEGAVEDPWSWEGKEKHRAHFQILLLTKILQFSAQMLSVFKSAPFISFCLVPDSQAGQHQWNIWQWGQEVWKTTGWAWKTNYFCLILICYWNLASRHGTDKM